MHPCRALAGRNVFRNGNGHFSASAVAYEGMKRRMCQLRSAHQCGAGGTREGAGSGAGDEVCSTRRSQPPVY